jgi:hypothetical protein
MPRARQQRGVDAIGLGERAGGLSKAPATFRVEFDTGPVAQRDLRRKVAGRRRLIGYPFYWPLPPPGNQGRMALGGVGKLALGTSRMGMAVEARFGDVDADWSSLIFSDVPWVVLQAENPGILSGQMEKKGAILL